MSRIALGANALYFTRVGPTPAVMRVAFTGGALTTLASGQQAPRNVVVDANSVYWLDTRPSGKSVVMKAPIAGGSAVTVSETSQPLTALAVHAGELFWGESGVLKRRSVSSDVATELRIGANIRDIAVDDPFAYVAVDDRVYRVPIDGDKPELLADDLGSPTRLAIDDMFVYWLDVQLRNIGRVGK